MAKYKITAPDGNSYVVSAPDNASMNDVLSYAKANYKGASQPQGGTDWKGAVSRSVKDMFQKPAAYAKDLGTNPETMARTIPPLMSTVGGISPVLGGSTMGMAVGQGIRNLALKGLGKPIPSGLQHAGELGGSVLADLIAVPAMKRSYYGGQIGKAEKAAGLVTRAPNKAVTPGTVGKTLNELEAELNDMQRAIGKGPFGGLPKESLAQPAKDAKAIVSQIFKNPKIYEQTPEINVQAARVSQKAQDLINRAVPGRLGPSQAMGKAMTIPNMVERGYQKIPWQAKLGLLGGGVDAVIRKLLGL